MPERPREHSCIALIDTIDLIVEIDPHPVRKLGRIAFYFFLARKEFEAEKRRDRSRNEERPKERDGNRDRKRNKEQLCNSGKENDGKKYDNGGERRNED